MRTIDFREIMAKELQDPEFRREFIIAYYEEDGIAGLRAALEEIAHADSRNARSNPQITAGDTAEESFTAIRSLLNEMGLDLRLVRINQTSETVPNRGELAIA